MGCNIKRILQFNDIIQAGPIRIYNKDNINITDSCQFCWSNDMVCWTNWVDYANYLRLISSLEEDVYIRVLLQDTFEKISINNVFTKCYTIWIDSSNPFLDSLCNDNTYNPYSGLDCALQLQQQLADGIVCMLGIPIYYFRVQPDKDSIDYTFKEYVMHDVISVKQLKLIVPDGTMPSSNPKFSALDFDWQVDWDVELGKTEFTTAFGEGIVPKMRDFIYIPMMKRMWKVNTAYDEKNEGLMWQSTTWKLSLIKYEDSDNVSIPDSMDDIIDNWITRYDEVLGNKEMKEQERTTGLPQISSPQPSPTNLCSIMMSDAVRAAYSKGEIDIITKQYNYKSNIVSRNAYKSSSLNATVVYQNKYCGSDGTLSFILQTPSKSTQKYNIINIGPLSVSIENNQDECIITCDSLSGILEKETSYLVIIRWNKSNYTISLNCYKYICISDLPSYLIKPEMYQFEEDPIINKTGRYNNDFEIIDGQECDIVPGNCILSNIKLYNKDLGLKESIKESIKYTTTNKNCIINDVVRPFTTKHGYAVH